MAGILIIVKSNFGYRKAPVVNIITEKIIPSSMKKAIEKIHFKIAGYFSKKFSKPNRNMMWGIERIN